MDSVMRATMPAALAVLASFALLLPTGTATAIPQAVTSEISLHGHAFILGEVAQDKGRDVLNRVRSELQEDCRIQRVWELAWTIHVDATSACVKRLSASALVTAIDLAGSGFIVSADSLAFPRYQRVAILGGGINDSD